MEGGKEVGWVGSGGGRASFTGNGTSNHKDRGVDAVGSFIGLITNQLPTTARRVLTSTLPPPPPPPHSPHPFRSPPPPPPPPPPHSSRDLSPNKNIHDDTKHWQTSTLTTGANPDSHSSNGETLAISADQRKAISQRRKRVSVRSRS